MHLWCTLEGVVKRDSEGVTVSREQNDMGKPSMSRLKEEPSRQRKSKNKGPGVEASSACAQGRKVTMVAAVGKGENKERCG